MSTVTIPCGETLDAESRLNSGVLFSELGIEKARTLVSYKYQRIKSDLLKSDFPTKSFSSYSCDPLLRFIDLADFQDDKKLQRNFEQVLRIREMGFPVKVIKQNWFPGLICIPVFHCHRCLALWTEAARVPTLCSEVNRSVYGRMLPISVTKCDLLTKLFNQDRNQGLERRSKTRSPLVKNVEKSAEKSYSENGEVGKRGSDEEKVPTKAQSGKRLSQPPVAEFVDIDEKIRKIRENVLRGDVVRQTTTRSRSRNECCTDDNPKSGINETSVTQEGGTGSEGEKTKMEYGERLGTDKQNVMGPKSHEESVDDLKSSSICARDSAPIQNTGKSSRLDRIGCKRLSCLCRGKEGNLARPSSKAGPEDMKNNEFYGRIHISSKQKDDRPEGHCKKTDRWPKKQGFRRENEGATKSNRAWQRALTLNPPESKVTHDVAEFIVVDGLKKSIKDEDELTKDDEVDEEGSKEFLKDPVDKNEQKLSSNQRSFGFEMMTNPMYMRLFKWDVTRAFCFSYFSLLRKVKKPDKR